MRSNEFIKKISIPKKAGNGVKGNTEEPVNTKHIVR